MSELLSLWPDRASSYAVEVDRLLIAFTILIVLLSAPVFILITVFAIRYRRGKAADRRHAANRNIWLEASWTIIPFLLLFGFYIWSTRLYLSFRHPPPAAMKIDGVAKQWMWKFQHPEGQAEINQLHIPAGQPVQLLLASQDVVHSLFIPALRVKQDVVPGRYTSMWFAANKPGIYRLACAQFCGTDHAVMAGEVIVMKPADYAHWLEQGHVDVTLAAQGERLFRSRGCSGCHGPSATVHAPSLAGLYGRPVPLQNGDVVTADEAYLRDSIMLPQKQIAAGYPAIMPTFENILSEEDVLKLIAYIKSIGGELSADEFQQNGSQRNDWSEPHD